MKKMRVAAVAAACLFAAPVFALAGCADTDETVVLRVSNWEEYIDLGDWGDDEAIDVENPYTGEDYIMGVNSVIDDFTEWFNSQDYGFDVRVEYSTFGTNEDLYNQLNLGDVYDLVCPSDYMIMKLLDKEKIQPFSADFMNPDIETNYYINNVSPYIDGEEDSIFYQHKWNGIAACYMWGTTGFVFNPDPELVKNEEDVAACNILTNSNYYKSVTVKDNVRDAYFAALSILYEDELNAINADESLSQEDKNAARSALLNDTDADTIAAAEDILKDIKDNVYSFETDSGKTDMVTGKVIANYQWSGDAVYIMDQADEEDTELWYSVPEESTNLWFDGWVMLKDGIDGNEQRKEAAEAFVNFLSRPDNAVRNMYYIGYTSSIAGDLVFDYMDWNYGFVFDPSDEEYFDEELTEVYEYDLSYFFGEGYTLYADASVLDLGSGTPETSVELLGEEYGNNIEYTVYRGGEINRGRQLFGQYPTANVIERSVVMLDFGDKLADINQMWIHVRCLDLMDYNPVVVGIVAAVIIILIAALVLYHFRYRIFIRQYKPRKGYKKIEA